MYTEPDCPTACGPSACCSKRGVSDIEEVRVDLQPAERSAMMQITGRRTVPQIFIGATHVGGCDDLAALDHRGGLAALLAGG